MTSPRPLPLLSPGYHHACQQVLLLAQRSSFRRAPVRKLIGSTNYSGRALQDLLSQDLLRLISVKHTTF